MFETFSMRARRVVFAARLTAGQRGAATIEMGDLLLGVLLEDQDLEGSLLLSNIREGQRPAKLEPLPSHIPFFPLGATDKLRNRIEKLLSQSEAVARTAEIPLSPDLKRAFEEATHIQNTYHHKRIEPLHILAGVLTEESSQYVKLLQEIGITKEQVLQRLSQPQTSEDE
jgi:hypothetical protein